MKHRELIANNLKEAGWSLRWVSAIDVEGRTIWILDVHGHEKHFVVRADEMRIAFVGIGRDDSRAVACGQTYG